MIFSSARDGVRHLYWQEPTTTAKAELLVMSTRQMIIPYAMSGDGQLIFRGARQGGSDLMAVNLGAGQGRLPKTADEQRLLIPSTFEETNADLSRDGRWLAYQANNTGHFEVYVRPFPAVERSESIVSTGGGTEPLWSRDGTELFYRSAKGAVMRISVAKGSKWQAGAATQIFESSSYAGGAAAGTLFVARTYDVSLDGRRFLMIKNVELQAASPAPWRIVVVKNWSEELNRLVPPR